MGQNDRLAHVLALGIFPSKWIKNNDDILINQGEYFDNLVWLWYKIRKLRNTNLDTLSVLAKYEKEIKKIAFEIYELDNVSILDLYKAWKYRKNCPIAYFYKKNTVILSPYYKATLSSKKINKKVQNIYEMYQKSNKVRTSYKKIIIIKSKDINKLELKIYEALQDKILTKIEKKGIIIDTNPSSNIFISSLSKYSNHPIFRFNPPKEKLLNNKEKFNKYNQRKGSILSTLNSDDPAIFSTSLQNEFRIIQQTAMQEFKCTKNEADIWVKKIRKFSLLVFKESNY
jgi:hypothetical protein